MTVDVAYTLYGKSYYAEYNLRETYYMAWYNGYYCHNILIFLTIS